MNVLEPSSVDRVRTGVRNLDALLDGGLPRGTVSIVAGPPGSGKTIFAQQTCFFNGSAATPALYFSTLSEPTAKTLRYLKQFSFFDPVELERGVKFIDLGVLVRSKGLDAARELMMEHVRTLRPHVVVVDSFKIFDDLAHSREDLRKFGYELAVHLMAWECTTLLLGEYGHEDAETNPLFSITDGLIRLSQREAFGEHQRFLQIVKMRGTRHSRDDYSMAIGDDGIQIFAPRLTIRRSAGADATRAASERCATRVSRLDDLVGAGIPRGSSLLVGGAAGSGKTVLLLEFVYRGAAECGEKGIIFSFEETPERLLATARGLGWDFEAQMRAGMLEVVFIPQPDIVVEQHLLMIRERVEASGARRVAIDSLSVFLHKVNDPQVVREKVFQLASVVQSVSAVGFFATDIPYGSAQLSRTGVEETVADGVILLSLVENGLERRRFIEVYKLRNTAHLSGRHTMDITVGGVQIYPRYLNDDQVLGPPPPIDVTTRLTTGVAAFDAALGGGVLHRSVTLVAGSTGVGKTVLAMHFALGGLDAAQRALFITLEENVPQVLANADALGLPLRRAIRDGDVEVLALERHLVRDAQLLTLVSDKVRSAGVRRLVVDGVGRLDPGVGGGGQLLHDFVVRCRMLEVTTMLTLESRTMFPDGNVTERGVSSVADNIVLLRYVETDQRLHHTLLVVKSRGSAHDTARHVFEIGAGGVRIVAPT